MKINYLILLIFLSGVSGQICTGCRTDTAGCPDSMTREQFKNYLQTRIRPGSSPADAEKILASLGFKCSYHYKDYFIECDPERQIGEHGPADYLYGDSEKSASLFSPVSVRRQVAVIIKNGLVSEVLVSEGYTGL